MQAGLECGASCVTQREIHHRWGQGHDPLFKAPSSMLRSSIVSRSPQGSPTVHKTLC